MKSSNLDALLVVDMQHGFMKRGADAVIAPVAELVRMMPREKLYYLKYRNHPDSSFTRHLDWHDVMTSTQANIVPDVYIEGAPVFDHFGYQPPPELMDELKKYKKVGLCGVDTDACVMAAAFKLWDADIVPVILAHYCASSGGPHFHEAALDMMTRQFGTGNVMREKVIRA